MKVYSIGRDINCDIVINDSTDVVSRRHAVLHVYPSGKMTITDQSHNGTYVNGIRINSNVAVPVTRKDNVSFAHVARLDWKVVPDPVGVLRYVAFAVLGLIVVVGAFFGVRAMMGGDDPKPAGMQVDSVSVDDAVRKLEEQEKQKQDSIRQKLRTDSIARAEKQKQAVQSRKAAEQRKKAEEQKKKDGQKAKQPARQDSTFRPRG